MNKFFEKIFGKKKKETVSDNLNQQNNISEQGINNQTPTQPNQTIAFNQNMNIENQSVNPLGFQPTAPMNNIENNPNAQEYNLNLQPTEINNSVNPQQPITFNQEPMMNTNPQPELNVMPQQIQNQDLQPQTNTPSNEVNNIVNPQPTEINNSVNQQQPITFNQEPMMNTNPQPELNVMPQQIQNQDLQLQPLQQETLNVIPTLGPTPNPNVNNQNNINNQNM